MERRRAVQPGEEFVFLFLFFKRTGSWSIKSVICMQDRFVPCGVPEQNWSPGWK